MSAMGNHAIRQAEAHGDDEADAAYERDRADRLVQALQSAVACLWVNSRVADAYGAEGASKHLIEEAVKHNDLLRGMGRAIPLD